MPSMSLMFSAVSYMHVCNLLWDQKVPCHPIQFQLMVHLTDFIGRRLAGDWQEIAVLCIFSANGETVLI